MSSAWYKKVTDRNLGYRDYLALDRTRLANERTLLSYLRTGFTSLITGISFIKFFETIFFHVTGLLLISGGFILLVIGFWKFVRMQHLIESIENIRDEEDDE